MTVKERVHRHVDALPESDLLVAERVLHGLTLVPGTQAVLGSPQQERKARIEAACGSMRGKLSSVDEFMAAKQEEIAREEAKWQRLHNRPATP